VNPVPPPIASDRLELVSLGAPLITALLEGDRIAARDLAGFTLPDGWPDEGTARFLRFRLRQLADDPGCGEWLVRAMVLRSPARIMVGHLGFHGPPDDRGRPELGYQVFPDHRRSGFAIEAVAALIQWAARTHGVERFLASVSPTNEPSLALVHKLGFVQAGAQWDDEDGLELIFVGKAPP
jgi:ribosomal-protein-alanine N-acetyltransferase